MLTVLEVLVAIILTPFAVLSFMLLMEITDKLLSDLGA